MKTGVIDGAISKQVDQMGSQYVMQRYSMMLNELTKSISEMDDKKRASAKSDLSNLIRLIINTISN